MADQNHWGNYYPYDHPSGVRESSSSSSSSSSSTSEEERSISGDGMSVNKSGIKIKLTVGDQSVHRQNSSPPLGLASKEDRICKVCNKGFSSGRALGGHMRVHGQAQVQADDPARTNNQPHFSKLKPHESINKDQLSYCSNGATADPMTKTTCSICGKHFPSMKSLFGHMRCHPERQWRGIRPPPSTTTAPKNSSSSTVSDALPPPKMDDQADSATTSGRTTSTLDLCQLFPNWSVTAKRGRKSLASTVAAAPVPEAVYGLLSLSIKRNRSEQAEAEAADATDLPPSTKGKTHRPAMNVDARRVYRDAADEEEEDPDAKSFSYMSEIYKNKKNNLSMIKKKKIKLVDLGAVQGGNPINYKEAQERVLLEGYKCTTCNKSFSTPQALGGHRSNYKVGKICLPIPTILDPEESSGFAAESTADEEQHRQQPVFVVPVNPSTKVCSSLEFRPTGVRAIHRCKTCDKTFSTGQALEGHQRCHSAATEAGTVVEAASNSVAYVQEEEDDSNRMETRRVLDFDLNELPAVDEEVVLESVHSL